MRKQAINLEYLIYDSLDELSMSQQTLLKKAREAAQLAYAPYSNFFVGAALELEGGVVVTGSNKENASFPAGICAERNALNYASDQFPDTKVIRMAVIALPKTFELNEPVTPCGVCRQVMTEFEQIQAFPMEVILSGQSGEVLVLEQCKDLLPLHFYLSELKK